MLRKCNNLWYNLIYTIIIVENITVKNKLERMNSVIKSMTGFGRGESFNELQNFNVEIKTVNHRYNDIIIKMPKHLNYLEEEIKKLIKAKILRGRVEVFIKLEYDEGSASKVNVDLPLARAYRDAIQELQDDLGMEDILNIRDLLRFTDIIKTEKIEMDEDETWNILKSALIDAIEEVVLMREKEGIELSNDIKVQVEKIETYLEEIQSRSGTVVEEAKEKLELRISELLDSEYEIDEEKLANEIVFLADKSDINEEIVRFKSHIDQLLNTIKEDDAVGRRLDFLIQEINREVNTIGSKSSDIEITRNVVNIKSEIEKIREQVQNIE